MGFLGRGRSKLPYHMFDVARDAEEARRYTRCANIYHKGQDLAWDGREILSMLVEKHGGVQVPPEKRKALERVFAIILWGELAAWKISAQLADELEPLEAKMAATSQAHDEARHFYTMYDYLQHLGYVPAKLDPAPQALLDLVLETDVLVNKILGMQLLIESIALAIFQEVRELDVEPVLAELMKYYERDEARHVGLGMQYLPQLMKNMSRWEISRMFLFQSKLVAYALWENKVLEEDFRVLGIDQRRIVDRARQKQLLALREAFEAIGWRLGERRNIPMSTIAAIVEIAFPTEENRGDRRAQLRAAWEVFTGVEVPPDDALDVHAQHAIRTARGVVAEGEPGIAK